MLTAHPHPKGHVAPRASHEEEQLERAGRKARVMEMGPKVYIAVSGVKNEEQGRWMATHATLIPPKVAR